VRRWPMSSGRESSSRISRTPTRVARVHARFFAEICPANTLLRGEPIEPEMLVEIEADAVTTNS
jgi:hypothetical protein